MTTNAQQKAVQTTPAHHDELILVIKRSDLFGQEAAWSGLKEVNFDKYLQLIQQKKQFLPRSEMEQDPTYKQIIPYLVFNYSDTFFLMQRTAQATEVRLQNKYSLGIGGHIRIEDMEEDSIFAWARREFHEEVDYEGDFVIEPLGILNDDSNAVGQVHVGFVFLLQGNSNKIAVKSELKSGKLVTLDEGQTLFNSMETWSQIVFEFLRTK